MKRKDIVVAGHICLDLIPSFDTAQRIEPGALIKIGPATFAPGGAVANTGIALLRLGASVQLAARIGDDPFGRELSAIFRREGRSLASRIRVQKGGATSYSIVISPPGVDRSFLHCSSENDHFAAKDLAEIDWERAAILHFGYPPMMRAIYRNAGRELASMMRSARSHGVITSLDMCMPDVLGESGMVDWLALCQNVLPHVDMFCPSLEELVFMLDRPRFDRWRMRQRDLAAEISAELLRDLSEQCLAMGAGAVFIKLGDQGVYLRSASDGRLAGRDPQWKSRELLCDCRQVKVVGTTGSGDCAIAGLLLALSRGDSPETSLELATAAGATCCEAADATSAMVKAETIRARIEQGWPHLKSRLRLKGWPRTSGVRSGPADSV